MQWPLRLLIGLLAGALAMPLVLPVAADGDDGGRADRDEDDEDDEGGEGDEGKEDKKEGKEDQEDEDGERDDRDGRPGEGREGRGEGRGDKPDQEGKPEGKGRGDRDRGQEDPGRGDGDRNDRRDDDTKGSPGIPPGAAPTRKASDSGIRVAQAYDAVPGLLTFTFTVTNHGPGAARDVRLHGELPQAGIWTLTDLTRCTLAALEVDCALGDLKDGESVEVTAHSVLAGDVPPFTTVVQVYTPGRLADRPSSP